MGLRDGLDWCGKSRPTGIRSPDRTARRQSLYRLRYPATCLMFKKIGKVFTSKFVGTGPSSYKKRIYRSAVSQRLRNTALPYDIMNSYDEQISTVV